MRKKLIIATLMFPFIFTSGLVIIHVILVLCNSYYYARRKNVFTDYVFVRKTLYFVFQTVSGKIKINFIVYYILPISVHFGCKDP